MKRIVTIGAGLLVLVLIGSPFALGGQMPMRSQGGAEEPRTDQPSMMGRGMMGMMCPMMAGQMDPSGMMSMMSMMGGGERDPKAMARILALRGDLLKAMGEVMLKHAKAMEAGQ
jgi:hypothetical protein